MQEFILFKIKALFLSLQCGIGWDEQNGLSLKVYIIIYSTRTYFPRPTCTKYVTCPCDKGRKA